MTAKFIVSMQKYGDEIEKFRDADGDSKECANQAELLQFLVKTDFTGWDKVTISEIIEKEIAEIEL